jgi:hypothetical protein
LRKVAAKAATGLSAPSQQLTTARKQIVTLQAEIATLKTELQALRNTKAATANASQSKVVQLKTQLPNGYYTEPFPQIHSLANAADFEARLIVDWFENRIVEGKLGPILLNLVGANISYLAQAYWQNGGQPKPCKRLDARQPIGDIGALAHGIRKFVSVVEDARVGIRNDAWNTD